MNTPKRVPQVVFKTHTHDKKVCGDDPFAWVNVATDEIFKGKKIALFALPGAFTPTCSSQHLPGYEAHYDEFKKLGIDEVICLSVNDAFVMNAWRDNQGVRKVRLLPDGSAEFTRGMNMLVEKYDLGFGLRSWRYSMYVEDGEIKKIFIEPGFSNNCPNDPFEVSDAQTMLKYLQARV
ncbi:MAG: peroxiredoxin [Candidatus Zambryskibacteria bacterium RIFCSPHIGHO2_01_FULL_46_30]|uniref:Glutathione-dependent peroxiredoxin n=1 Tax=Candidatus Zambryskibacteria bacterium RIFCSPHIGHO2_01_FULL_46_30 TaxID=1802739 RepID=A0A1G2T3J5_9BACT|nr:MAG: peroxiredoxin [Candidatus Zambryskibacteria bacterium RIFCSPHIGHO2_01_FULL_46_30]OHB06417.1 MAG: peroxiredoxin [Candidatus Zambryskibacteria bacterium RIFCSPLOWO2_01_FULL_47_33]